MKLAVIILAAGQGTRMRSRLPKVLHTLGGRPLLGHVLDTARALTPTGIYVVYGHGGAQVQAQLDAEDLQWVEQREQRGTGHAVRTALEALGEEDVALILYGDVPGIAPRTLQPLIDAATSGALALLVAEPEDPHGYGRIVRDSRDRVLSIVEEKDTDEIQRAIREVNTGLLAAPVARLRRWIVELNDDNAQGEYLLTDIVAAAVAEDTPVVTSRAPDLFEVAGVNDRVQLAALERQFQRHQAEALMRSGVSVADPERLDIRGSVEAGRDCFIDINVVLEGRVQLGADVTIEPNCVLRDVTLADGVTVRANSVLEGARVEANAVIGPFARLRPGADIGPTARVGNFVEVKQARLEEGAKVNHLSYIGDADVGAHANVGAGTITCNYDGVNKHRTTIGAGAFIGSGTNLVAPVTIGENATIGAGSTVTKPAPADELTVSRARQTTVRGWRRPD